MTEWPAMEKPAIDLGDIQDILVGSLHIPANNVACVKLAGDAGNRRYYRVFWNEGPTARTLILMVLTEPEGFKASEEAMSANTNTNTITELPFINIQKHLQRCKIAVPEITCYEPQRGWIFLEDLGDLLLIDAIRGKEESTVVRLYEKAIDELVALQIRATPTPNMPTLVHERFFDAALLMWEFDHFIEYGIEKQTGRSLPDPDKTMIRGFFSDIARRLASLPQVFTHRDYHSRNLLVQQTEGIAPLVGDRIRVIDFQDALMGPCQYDLASLLRDSYVDLPEPVIDHLIAYYLDLWEAHQGQKVHREMFREFFDLISIQRNLKAAGRFVYIDCVKKNPNFLCNIPPTLAKVKRNLMKYPRLSTLHHYLAKYVEALQ